MSAINICPECQSPLPEGAPQGLCPACLLKAGMTSDHVEPGTKSGSKTFTPPTPAELAPHFPQLEILELIGQGGMGAVYKAKQVRLDRVVALKVLPKDAERGQEFADRFTREAKAMARLSHPNIIAIHDYGEAGGWFYFVMEFVDGVNMRQAMKTEPIKPSDALAIVTQICDALQYAHEESVVHRDIKPENILLTRKGKVKIADFGLAKLLGMSAFDRHLTATQQVMGTIGYMAPEQMEGSKAVDHRADIYALGVVFYELLTGELPMGRFAPPSQKVQVDIRVDEVVLKSLEREPDRRYQSASQIKHEVERISSGPAQPSPSAASAPMSAASTEALKVRLPVIGSLMIILGLCQLAVVIGIMINSFGRGPVRFNASNVAAVFSVVDFIGLGLITAIGGLLIMLRIVHLLAVVSAFLSMVPLATIGTLIADIDFETLRVGNYIRILDMIGIPLGIWALIELNQAQVKGQFRWPLLPMLAAAWRFLFPRILNSTFFTVVAGTALLFPMIGCNWAYSTGHHDDPREWFSDNPSSLIAVYLTIGTMLFLLLTWQFTWKPVLWRPVITIFGGLAILTCCLYFTEAMRPSIQIWFREGLTACLWVGGIICLNGVWRLSRWFARKRKVGVPKAAPVTVDEPISSGPPTVRHRAWLPWVIALVGIAVAVPTTIWIAAQAGLIHWQPSGDLELRGTFYVRPGDEAWVYFVDDFERPPSISFSGMEARTVQVKQCETYGFQWKSIGKSDFMDSGTITWTAKGRRASGPRKDLPKKGNVDPPDAPKP